MYYCNLKLLPTKVVLRKKCHGRDDTVTITTQKHRNNSNDSIHWLKKKKKNELLQKQLEITALTL